MNMDILFNSPSGSTYNIPDLVREIKSFIDEDPYSFYSLIIGTDSQAKGSMVTRK